MSSTLRAVVPFVAWIALLAVAGSGWSQVRHDDIRRAVDESVGYLVRRCGPSGQFQYRVNMNPKILVRPRYNILRHAGAMVALAQSHTVHPTDRTKGTLIRAGSFLKSQIDRVEDLPKTSAVWSDPKVNGSRQPMRAKLGGTGLGLVALCSLEPILPGSARPSQLQQLGEFALFMQRDDGGFFSIYYPQGLGRDGSWTSLYYPGEAALGLMMLNDIVPDPDWVRGAREALLFLAHSRRGQERVPADHWALIASQKLLSAGEGAGASAAERSMLIEHAKQIVRSMLAEQSPQIGHQKLDGCFTADGRTTPTATRLEGLLAVAPLLKKDDLLWPRTQAACQRGVQFLLRCQSQEPPYRGGMPRAMEPLPQEHPLWSAEFNARATEIRIDYVQHAISAWIGYLQAFEDASKP